MQEVSLTSQVEQIWQEHSLGLGKDLYRRRGVPLGRDVLKAAALHFRFPAEFITADRRQGEIVYARHVAMYVAYMVTNNSTPAIGRIFGNRDHTTVLHAIRKIEKWVDEGRQSVLDDIEAIKKRVANKNVGDSQ